MYQPDRGTYGKESYASMFFHSCLGKIVILVFLILALLLIARITIPSKEKMTAEMEDNIRECIQENDSIQGDKLDDMVGNVFRIFTKADTTANDKELVEAFYQYNKLQIYPHFFYSTARIHNNFRPEGTRVGIGIFGLVIPTVNFNDFLLRTGPVRREYNQQLIKPTYSTDEYYGDNPDLGNTYDTYEGGGSTSY